MRIKTMRINFIQIAAIFASFMNIQKVLADDSSQTECQPQQCATQCCVDGSCATPAQQLQLCSAQDSNNIVTTCVSSQCPNNCCQDTQTCGSYSYCYADSPSTTLLVEIIVPCVLGALSIFYCICRAVQAAKQNGTVSVENQNQQINQAQRNSEQNTVMHNQQVAVAQPMYVMPPLTAVSLGTVRRINQKHSNSQLVEVIEEGIQKRVNEIERGEKSSIIYNSPSREKFYGQTKHNLSMEASILDLLRQNSDMPNQNIYWSGGSNSVQSTSNRQLYETSSYRLEDSKITNLNTLRLEHTAYLKHTNNYMLEYFEDFQQQEPEYDRQSYQTIQHQNNIADETEQGVCDQTLTNGRVGSKNCVGRRAQRVLRGRQQQVNRHRANQQNKQLQQRIIAGSELRNEESIVISQDRGNFQEEDIEVDAQIQNQISLQQRQNNNQD